jgi:predicted nucleic acid-binding protein
MRLLSRPWKMPPPRGSLVVCDLAYAELCIHFSSQSECDAFLDGNEIRVEPLNRGSLFLASRAFRTYRKQGGPRARILADFLIGAHAQTQATRLLSRDRGFYRKLSRRWISSTRLHPVAIDASIGDANIAFGIPGYVGECVAYFRSIRGRTLNVIDYQNFLRGHN